MSGSGCVDVVVGGHLRRAADGCGSDGTVHLDLTRLRFVDPAGLVSRPDGTAGRRRSGARRA